MAQVHVHVHTAKPRRHRAKSTLRWADRALLGVVMGILAFTVERAVKRSTKKANEASAAER